MPASTTEDEAAVANAKQYSLKTVDFLLGTNTKIGKIYYQLDITKIIPLLYTP